MSDHDRGGNQTSLQIFLVISTCLLYLVAAGLCTRGVWYLENNTWNHLVGGETAEMGAGPGSYDIRQSVWHVNCCSPLQGGGGGWGIFNAILGWTNSATYGSVLSYNFYWLVVILWFVLMRYKENRGHFPLLGSSQNRPSNCDGPDPEVIECTGGMAISGENKAMDPMAPRLHTASV